MKLNLNIHYLTYPLLVVVALASLYWYGGYKQRQADKEKARADSIAVVAKKAIEEKHIADSLFADSVAKVNVKIKADDKAVIVAKKDRDSTAANLIKAVKDNEGLRNLVNSLTLADSALFARKDSTIKDRDDKILFITVKIHGDSLRYDALAKLNTSTNIQLAKAIADAHPGLIKRVIQNWDIELITVAGCHFARC
jgi:flagellar biosynthesis component FlhA